LVTDDSKPDWWWIAESNGKKTIGPRPELSEEIYHAAGVENFHIYNSDRFIEYANKYLGIPIQQESIAQIGDIRQLLDSSPHAFGKIIEEAVYRWLSSINPSNNIKCNSGFPDFEVLLKNGRRVGYEVKLIRRNLIRNLIANNSAEWQTIKNDRKLDRICLVLVARSQEKLISSLPEVKRWAGQMNEDIVVLLGCVEFTPDPANPKFVLKTVVNGGNEFAGHFDSP
jgi:hypothetical protein